MPRCRGKCELQLTRIITDPILPEVDTDPAGGALLPPATKADTTTAVNNLTARIAQWAQTVATTPCTAATCECHQTDANPTDAQWADKNLLKRTFATRFPSNNRNWIARVEIEYKIAYVAGACEEPPREVFYVGGVGAIPDLGITVSADEDGVVTAAALEKIRKALT